jgi:hypothetical protein
VRSSGHNGFEFFLSLQGSLGLILFHANGEIFRREKISATGALKGVELPEGLFHTILALEIKEGLYNP